MLQLHIYTSIITNIVNTMFGLISYLLSFFEGNSYQSRLDRYIASRNVADASQLEYYVREFERNQHKAYL